MKIKKNQTEPKPTIGPQTCLEYVQTIFWKTRLSTTGQPIKDVANQKGRENCITKELQLPFSKRAFIEIIYEVQQRKRIMQKFNQRGVIRLVWDYTGRVTMSGREHI